MSHLRGRVAAQLAGLALVAMLVLPAAAAAAEFTSPPGTGPITATLPLFGSSLTVDVSVDDAGNLSSVALDPVGDYTATVLRPHAVQFKNTDGSVKVTISAWGGHSSLEAKAGTLAALVGSGTWKADIFKTGDPTIVHYTIGDDGAGAPTLAIDLVDAPGAIEATVGDVKTKSHGNGASARVGIEFAWNGFTKRLSVGVAVGTKHDKTAARLQITLSGRSVQKVTGPLADVLGDHTWTGKLCDGTDVSIAFQVVDDGTANGDVTFDPETFATGAEAVAKDLRHGEGFVAFFKEKRAAVLVWLKKSDDGTYDLAVGSFIGKWCKGTEIANPTVNTPVAPDATSQGWWGGGWWGWWGWGWGHGHHGHHGGGDQDGDGRRGGDHDGDRNGGGDHDGDGNGGGGSRRDH